MCGERVTGSRDTWWCVVTRDTWRTCNTGDLGAHVCPCASGVGLTMTRAGKGNWCYSLSLVWKLFTDYNWWILSETNQIYFRWQFGINSDCRKHSFLDFIKNLVPPKMLFLLVYQRDLNFYFRNTSIHKQVQYLITVWIGQQIDYTFAFQLLIAHSSPSGHHLPPQFMFVMCKWVFVWPGPPTRGFAAWRAEGAGASYSSAAWAWTLDSGGSTAAWWQGHS